jgi:hypothetical protein
MWETCSPVQTQRTDSGTCEVQWKWHFNDGLARPTVWWAGMPRMVTMTIFIPSVQIPPVGPHWLSTKGQGWKVWGVYYLPRSHLSFIISSPVIFKYACLGIGQSLEADLSLHLLLSLWGGKAPLWYMLSGTFLPISSLHGGLPLPCQLVLPQNPVCDFTGAWALSHPEVAMETSYQ